MGEEREESQPVETTLRAAASIAGFKCLNPDEILQNQISAIEEVNSLCQVCKVYFCNNSQISAGCAKALLEHCKWDKDRLIDQCVLELSEI